MSSRLPFASALVLGASLLVAAPVRAESPAAAAPAPNMEEARQHAAKAKVHYDLGEFEQAAEEYILVYRIKPIPAILYNIAQAYRQASKYQKALQFYRSYLRETTDPKAQASLKKTIKEVEDLITKDEKTRNLPPSGVTEPPPASMVTSAEKDKADAGSLELAPPKPAAAKTPAAPLAPPPAAPPAAKEPAKDLAPPALASKEPAKPPALAQPPATPAQPPVAPPATAAKPPPAAPAKEPAAKEPAKAPGTAVAVAPRTAPPAAPPAATKPAAARPLEVKQAGGGGSRTLAYVVGGGAVALLGVGGLFFMQAKSTDDEITGAAPGSRTRAQTDALIDSSKSKHMLSAVLLGAGAAAAVGAGVLFFVLPSSSGAAVGAKGSF